MRKNRKEIPEISVEKAKQNKANIKTLIILTVISILFAAVYFFITFTELIDGDIKIIIMISFLSLLAGFSFAFIFYNKGFTQKKMTAEMLPAEWTDEAKETFLRESKARMKKSKWMLYIIFPLIVTFALDCILLYVVPFFYDVFN